MTNAAERKYQGQKLGGKRVHELHPNLAKEAGSKGGETYSINHPESRTSEHGKKLAAYINPENRYKPRTKWEYSRLCIQCGEPSKELLVAFCSPICRRRYNDRVQYAKETYGVSRNIALIIVAARTLELQIRRITKPHAFIRQGSLNRLPYTRGNKKPVS